MGMFLSWRIRWDTVWAVRRQFMLDGDMRRLWLAYRRAPPSVMLSASIPESQ